MRAKRSTEVLVPDKKWLDVPRAKITPCALILPNDIDFETWAAIGPRLGKLKRSLAWWTGDWLAQGEIIFNKTYSQAADTTGLDPAYLMILKHVAAKIAPERRRGSLSFSHHKIVAGLEASEQEKLLDLAEEQGLSRDELAAVIKQFKKNIEPPEPDGEPETTDGEVERVFYHEGTDHGAVVVDPLAEFNIKKIIAKILDLLNPASELEIRQVLAAIQRRFLPVRKIEGEIQ